jgi:transcriptional regulator with XRE-family HTH domain
MDYGAKLKELRMKLLITQTELADMLGVSFATVNRWENGHNEPTMRQKRAIRDLCRENGLEFNL